MPNAGSWSAFAWMRPPRGSASAKTGLRELQKRARPMRQAESLGWQAVFLHTRHLPEREIIAIRKKNGIVAKSPVAAWWPNQRAIDSAFKLLHVTVRPGDTQRRHEVRGTGWRCHRTAVMQLLIDLLHSRPKILVRACPPGRMDAGRTSQRIDRKPGVIRKGRQARPLGGRGGLYTGIFPKRRAGLAGLNEAKLAGRNRVDAERFNQFPHFPQLAGIVGPNHQPSSQSLISPPVRQHLHTR